MRTNKLGSVNQQPLYVCTGCISRYEDCTWPVGDLRAHSGECWCYPCWDERRWDFPDQLCWNDLEPYTPALQAECKELRTALAESRANDLTAMGYLNQIRGLVGGDDFPDMVRRCEKLRTAMAEAKSHIEHYMYGGSSYCRPAEEAIAIIDAAMEGDKP